MGPFDLLGAAGAAAVGVLTAACSGLAKEFGRRSRLLKDIEIYEHVSKMRTVEVDDDLTIELLRGMVFREARLVALPPAHLLFGVYSLRDLPAYAISLAAFLGVYWWARGGITATDVVFYIFEWALFMWATAKLTLLLRKHPATKRNPFYAREQAIQKEMRELEDAKRVYERSKYGLYEEREGEHRNARSEEKQGKEAIDAGRQEHVPEKVVHEPPNDVF